MLTYWKFLSYLFVSLMLVVSGPAYGGRDYVSLIKNSYLPIDKSITLGTALNTYKYFSNTEWKSFTGDKGRNIVEFIGIVDTKKLNRPEDLICKIVIQFYINYDNTSDMSSILHISYGARYEKVPLYVSPGSNSEEKIRLDSFYNHGGIEIFGTISLEQYWLRYSYMRYVYKDEIVPAIVDNIKKIEQVLAHEKERRSVRSLPPYLVGLQEKIRNAWNIPPQLKDLYADVFLRVNRAGQIEEARLVPGSGNAQFDESLQRAIKQAQPLPPLPEDYTERSLEVTLLFPGSEEAKKAAQQRIVELRTRVGSGGSGAGSGSGSGTTGIRLRTYQAELQAKIKDAWSIPLGSKGLQAAFFLSINRAGQVEQARLVRGSGNTLFDESLQRAIKQAQPLPPLPENFTDATLEVTLFFRDTRQ
jgi:TonB family protein